MSKSDLTYIAIVDDDESLSRALSRLLRVSDFHPVSYRSAEAFLADTKHPKFDCLVLDVHLEGMSGIQLNRQLTEAGSQTPVIFITAQNDPHLREEALASGCVRFIHKPEPGSVVIDAIRSAIGQDTDSDQQTFSQP